MAKNVSRVFSGPPNRRPRCSTRSRRGMTPGSLRSSSQSSTSWGTTGSLGAASSSRVLRLTGVYS
eukprot:1873261-Pyramimonas_sp.AAC.1